MVAAEHNNHGGGIKGKEKIAEFRNLKTFASSSFHHDQCDLYSEKAKTQIGAELTSNINGKIKTNSSNINGKIKTNSLTLDLFLRVERGNGGK